MKKRTRHTIRLQNWDYSSPGYYFITISAYKHGCIFGKIKNNKIELNNFGEIVQKILESLPERFPINLNEYQIMPNHIHMIIHIVVGAIHESPLQKKSNTQKRSLLSKIIGYFKMNTSKYIHMFSPDLPVWQRNYHDHIIRNEQQLNKIRKYIQENPLNWEIDKNNPVNIKNT